MLKSLPFIIDSHLDLSMNAMEWNRDLRLPVADINQREKYLTDKPDRAKSTVSLAELRKGNIGLVVATQIARYVAPGNLLPGWFSPQQAWAQTQAQLAWYKAMEEEGEMVMITDKNALEKHLSLWMNDEPSVNKPVGYILSLEGADSLITVHHLERAYRYGLRAVGPAHYGLGRYANGTDAYGHLTQQGRELLAEMERLNMILDVTHLCDDAFWDALSIYKGHIWASHHNCRALVNHNRQLSDDMILALAERNAVIGVAFDAWMLVPNWVRGISIPQSMGCYLSTVTEHIDHICQLTGNTLHAAIGSDLDGAFGREQCPADLESIADIPLLANLLLNKGYSNNDVDNIFQCNWLRFLKNAWQ